MFYPILIFCRLSRRRRLEISLSGKSSSAAKKKADNFEQLRKDHPLSASTIRDLFKVQWRLLIGLTFVREGVNPKSNPTLQAALFIYTNSLNMSGIINPISELSL